MDGFSSRRLAVISLGWVLVLLPAAGLFFGRVGTIGPMTAMLVALVPFMAPPAWIGIVIAHRRRRPVMLLAAVMVTTVHALSYVLAPLSAGPTLPIPQMPRHDGLRLFSANVRAESEQIPQVIGAAIAVDADLVLLQEIGPEDIAPMLDRAVDAGFGHRILDPLPGYFGGAVLSKWPVDGSAISVGGYPMISARVRTPEGDLGVVNVHAVAPLDRENHRVWRTQLAELRTMLTTTASPLVLAGDFNATPDHVELRRVAEAGIRSQVLGLGSSATFPDHGPLPPLLALDHVIASRDVVLVGWSTVEVAGSDHRGLIVDLVLSS